MINIVKKSEFVLIISLYAIINAVYHQYGSNKIEEWNILFWSVENLMAIYLAVKSLYYLNNSFSIIFGWFFVSYKIIEIVFYIGVYLFLDLFTAYDNYKIKLGLSFIMTILWYGALIIYNKDMRWQTRTKWTRK